MVYEVMDTTFMICFSWEKKKVFRKKKKKRMNAMCDTSRSALPTGGAGLRSVWLPGLRGHILEGLTHLQPTPALESRMALEFRVHSVRIRMRAILFTPPCGA